MKEKTDYFSYLIGVAGLILTAISFFKEEPQRLIFLLWGAAGVVIAVIMIYVNGYVYKLEEFDKELKDLKKESGFSKEVRQLQDMVERLKMSKKGKYTDLEDLIKVMVLLVLIYLILKALGLF